MLRIILLTSICAIVILALIFGVMPSKSGNTPDPQINGAASSSGSIIPQLKNWYVLYLWKGNLFAKSVFDSSQPIPFTNPMFTAFSDWTWLEKNHIFAMRSSDSGDLYVLREPDGVPQLLLKLKDVQAQGGFGQLSWSPNGERLLWSTAIQLSTTDPDKVSLWLVSYKIADLASKPIYIPSNAFYPDLSPDNQTVVFDGDRNAQFGNMLQLLPINCFDNFDPDKCKPKTLSAIDNSYYIVATPADNESPDSWHFPKWSPDGKNIAFECNTGICTLTNAGTHFERLPTAGRNDFFWSSDGRYIASDNSDQFSIVIYDTVTRQDYNIQYFGGSGVRLIAWITAQDIKSFSTFPTPIPTLTNAVLLGLEPLCSSQPNLYRYWLVTNSNNKRTVFTIETYDANTGKSYSTKTLFVDPQTNGIPGKQKISFSLSSGTNSVRLTVDGVVQAIHDGDAAQCPTGTSNAPGSTGPAPTK